jgi:hypothetical protein
MSVRFVERVPSINYERCAPDGTPWREIVAALKARPHETGIVQTYTHSGTAGNVAYRIKHGHPDDFKDGVYEAYSRRNDEGTYDVYVTYLHGRNKCS